MFKPHLSTNTHHPCGAFDCKCPTTLQIVSTTYKRPYEVQIDNYKCGPVSIINALYFVGREAGPALRRVIMNKCRTCPVHSDGFRGTRPDDMNNMIRLLWPECPKFVGIRDCKRALRSKDFQGYIILYSAFWRNKQYYHYVFTFKSSENHNIYITQNDGDRYELKWTLGCFVNDHLGIEGDTPIKFPQLWVVA